MKEFSEIRNDKRFQAYRISGDRMEGWVTIKGAIFYVICSNSGGWDHVSVSHKSQCPPWGVMCIIKDIFFDQDECCVEYHPAKKNYVNIHPNCLHIWKPQNRSIPVPPKIFV